MAHGKGVSLVCLAAALLAPHAHAYSERYETLSNYFLAQQNALTLNVVANGQDLGELTVFRHIGGTYVPLQDITRILGFNCITDPESGIAFIEHASRDYVVEILLNQQEYRINGESHRFFGNEVLPEEFEFFVDAALLARLFPLKLTVDEAALEMRVTIDPDFLVSWRDVQEDAPIVEATETQVEWATGQVIPEQEDILRMNVPAEQVIPSAVPGTEMGVSAETEVQEVFPAEGEEEVMVVQPALQGFDPFPLFLETYQRGKMLFIPLQEMVELLEFQITLSDDQQHAEGWFIHPDNQILLDVPAHQLTLNGKVAELSSDMVMFKDDILYVSSESMVKWFGVETKLELRSMTLKLIPHKPLPLQLRQERQKKWESYLQKKQKKKKLNYIPRSEAYTAADWPFLDVNLNQSLRNSNGNSRAGSDYTIQAAGDLGYVTTEAFVSGSDADSLSNVRLSAGRKDASASLMGPWNATEAKVGDIDAFSLPLVTQTSLGRGFRMTNRPLDFTSEFDQKDFTGNATPGWEVELYRNNVLLDFQQIGNDGRYSFLDIPVLYGNNTFRIVFYGPQGQIEEEVQQFFAGGNMLQKGKLQYALSADEKGESLLGVSNATTRPLDAGVRAVADVQYGLSDNLTAGLGVAHTPLDGDEHQYVNANASAVLGGVFANVNLVSDVTTGGMAASTRLLTSIKDVSIRASHDEYRDFISEVEDNYANPHRSQTSLDANGQFTLPLLQDVNLGGQVLHEKFSSGNDRMTYRGRIYKSLFGFGLNTSVEYVQDDNEQMNANFSAQGRIGETLIRAGVDMAVKPTTDISNVSLTLQKRLSDDLISRTLIMHQPNQNGTTSLFQALTWRFPDYNLTLQGDVNDKGDTFIGANLSFALGRDPSGEGLYIQSMPMSGAGAAYARVFMDDNYNGVWDEGEEILPESTILVNRRRYPGTGGSIFAAPVMPYLPTEVSVDLGSIKDPLLFPSVDGYSVVTRPGNIIGLDFPLISTSELDGSVYSFGEDGELVGMPEVVLDLVDAQGNSHQSVRTEFDGFYYISRVRPGTYRIEVPDEYLKEYGLIQQNIPEVVVKEESDFYSDLDIMLERWRPEGGVAPETNTDSGQAGGSVVLPAEAESVRRNVLEFDATPVTSGHEPAALLSRSMEEDAGHGASTPTERAVVEPLIKR